MQNTNNMFSCCYVTLISYMVRGHPLLTVFLATQTVEGVKISGRECALSEPKMAIFNIRITKDKRRLILSVCFVHDKKL